MIHVHFTSSRESSNSNFGFSETFHKQKGINLTPKKAQSTTQHNPYKRATIRRRVKAIS